MEAAARHMRTVTRREDEGVPGKDKRFLYDIVANKLNGLDVDKLDYFQRDSYFSGVVKVSFDTVRLMMLARVAMVAEDGRNGPIPEGQTLPEHGRQRRRLRRGGTTFVRTARAGLASRGLHVV